MQTTPSLSNRVALCCSLTSSICWTGLSYPCCNCSRFPKKPSWGNQFTMIVGSLRATGVLVPRDLSTFRYAFDQPIPDALLPSGALREKIQFGRTGHGECVWPKVLVRSTPLYQTSLRKAKGFFTPERLLEWAKLVPVVLYIHGGAFCLGTSFTHRKIIYNFAIEGHQVYLVPTYRRPPEASIVDAVEDCYNAYQYLLKDVGIPSERICVMGDSAGGALTILTLCKIRDNKTLPMAKCSVLLSPWVNPADESIRDMVNRGQSNQQQTQCCHRSTLPEFDYIPLDILAMFSELALNGYSHDDPLVNAYHADLTGLPAILIQVGELEVLLPQIISFTQKCVQAGTEVKLTVLSDMVHIPTTFANYSKVAKEANTEVVRFVNRMIVN